MKEVTDCDLFASMVDVMASQAKSRVGLARALRARFAPSETVASTEFGSSGFRDEFTDNVGPGNTPNQVRHYSGVFRAVVLFGVAGHAYANFRERGGTPSNQADRRLNGVAARHAMAVTSRHRLKDLANMIRSDVCKPKT